MVPSNCRIVAFSLTFVTLLVSWQLARYCDNRLPYPVLKPLPGSDRFVSSLAHRSLTQLTNFGPRPVGSYANDVQAVGFLVEELSKLATSSLMGRAAMEVDVQTVEGIFSLDIFGGAMTQVYSGVRNVVARISPRNGSAAEKPRAALLLNCHFDSVPMGPGASDDGVSCAILLEVARVVLDSKRVTLTNDLIFLFNGAEEALLPASHGFITQHRWAKDVAAFINLEAAGSGGREVLFQAGPGHRWLLDAYITAAPHPFASILCQEVFQSGVIPSDTDFRVFRDFGHVPGLDIAFVKAGEVYHTEFDTSSRIPLGSIQRAGDNVLAITLRLARRKSLAAADDDGSSSVFFDVLGLVMVALPAWLAAAVNIAVVGLVCLLAWRDAETFSKKMDTTTRLCLVTTLVLLASEVVTLVLGVTFSSLLGLLMGTMGLSMTWYSRPSLLLLLHTCPTVLILLLVYKRIKTILRNRASGVTLTEEFLETSCLHSVKLLSSLVCLSLTLAGIKSAFLLSVTVVFLLVWEGVRRLLSRPRGWASFLLLLLILTLPLAMWAYVIQLLLTIFLPIMGRRGAEGNPDIILGVAVSILTLVFLHLLLPIFLSVRKQGFLRILLVLSFLTGLLQILLGYGFPYSGDPAHPAPQRLSVYHVRREVGGWIDSEGREVRGKREGGVLLGRWDAHWADSLVSQVPLYGTGHIVGSGGECGQWLGCGLPLHKFSLDSGKGALWINESVVMPSLQHSQPTAVSQVSREITPTGGTNVTLQFSGPGTVVVLLSPGPGLVLSSWSLTSQPKPRGSWRKGQVYHLQLVRGMGSQTQQFWLELEGRPGAGKKLEGRPGAGEELLTLSVAGHYNSGRDMVGPGLRELLQQHPAWVSAAAWTVDYKYLQFRS